ncbi:MULTISPECIES: GH25 family lysozyme [Micrococcaceae]|uniref:lysozyme n=1 Tax=Arthrobacter rhombi TaxID=71253 RepID=A0A1R4FH96_9MICC|nr:MULTISPECIES: GH25 family lysozyme [Micrococcaceae]SJM55249.1 putative secreted hydrolase [Arthrobacter rhombi]
MPLSPARSFRFAAIPLAAAFALTSAMAPVATAAPAAPPPADSNLPEPAGQEIADALADGRIPAAERKALAERASEALGEEVLPAQMGQGQKRIAETGDPQVPTLRELAELGRAAGGETTSIPDLPSNPAKTPNSTVSPSYTSGNGWWRPPGVPGVDVSAHQGNVDWAYAKKKGARFAYVKATQSWPSSVYKNPNFTQQYNGSHDAGMIRGAYHFAMPAASSAKTQARAFVANGGGWSADGKTMPPLLDIEWNPYDAKTFRQGKGDTCYGMSPKQLSDWIHAFGVEVRNLTGRLPMIYTAGSWWNQCTNSSSRFKNWDLHVARYPASAQDTPGALPGGWTNHRVWQYATDTGFISKTAGVDGNVFNGSLAQLRSFAKKAG